MPILFDRVSDFKGALSFEALKNKRVSNVLGIPRIFYALDDINSIYLEVI